MLGNLNTTCLDLIQAPDAWLQAERTRLEHEISLLSGELHDVVAAQSVKTTLQQRNLVPAIVVGGSPDGDVCAAVIICPVGEAVRLLEGGLTDRTIPPSVSQSNYEQQVSLWRADGYDVDVSRLLAMSKEPI